MARAPKKPATPPRTTQNIPAEYLGLCPAYGVQWLDTAGAWRLECSPHDKIPAAQASPQTLAKRCALKRGGE
jgi:hypothetical protein